MDYIAFLIKQASKGGGLVTPIRGKKLRHFPTEKIRIKTKVVIPRSMQESFWARQMQKPADFAPGLPDPKRFGNVKDLPTDEPLRYVVQRHLARRAGPHYDIRFGPDDLYSWATKKELPKPGEKTMVYQQPLHKGEYAHFEGTLTHGYGAGTVKTHDKGQVIVQHADPNKIKFSVIHHKFPETYTMIRYSGAPKTPQTERQAQTQGGSWLMMNTTPVDAVKMLGGKTPGEVGLEKPRFKAIPAAKVDKVFDPKYLVQEKVDGASLLYHLLADHIEALSYRVSKGGRPIVHTYRVFGPSGSLKGAKIPPELQGTILRGEVFGEHKGKAIEPQELGGILNASVAKSLQMQKDKGVTLKNMLWDVARLKDKPIPFGSVGADERMRMLHKVLNYLPKDRFQLPVTAETPEKAKALWEHITAGKSPRTDEGIVAWPRAPGIPTKIKKFPEADVWIKNIFPGAGRLTGSGAGGFEYANAPEGPVVGRVGTGFNEETRKQMLADPSVFVDRMARIRSQGKFPESGAHRAPAFIALHEDYPNKAASAEPALSEVMKKRAMTNPLEDPERSLETVHIPVKPSEIATSLAYNMATPAAMRVAAGSPLTVSGMIGTLFSPSALPLTAVGDVVTAPFFDPAYELGEKGYLDSLASGISTRADRIGELGRNVRKRYGVFGVPLQALHGILNPVSGSLYGLRSMHDYFFGKAGEVLATRAEAVIDKALRE